MSIADPPSAPPAPPRALLQPLGGWAGRHRWVLGVTLLVLVAVSIVLGRGVVGRLASGGFSVEGGESSVAAEQLETHFGVRAPDYVVAYRHPEWSVDDPAFQAELAAVVGRVSAMPEVGSVQAPLVPGTPLRSLDGRVALLLLSMSPDVEPRDHHAEVTAALRDTPLFAEIGGSLAAHTTAQDVSRHDLVRAELIALPLVFGLLLWLFRSVVAALVPLVIGFASIEIAMLMLRGLVLVTDVSLFAMNVVTFLGLGLAVDYSLFMVLRFREELMRTGDVDESLRRTTATAGRTVLVSGVAVAASLLGLLWFEIPVLRSIAIGGTCIAGVTVVVTLVFLPAILAMLGRRIDAGRIGRRPSVRSAQNAHDVPAGERTAEPARPEDVAARNRWYDLALAVMRRPVLVALGVTAILVVVALPMRRLVVEPGDARLYPAWTEVRQVADLAEDGRSFPTGELGPIEVVVELEAPSADDPVGSLASTLATLPDVTRVDAVPAPDGRHAYLRVVHRLPPTGEAARGLVEAVRSTIHSHEASGYGALTAWIGGRAAESAEIHAEISRAAPRALATIAAVTFVVLLLAFGSLVIPLEALFLNALSVCAAYGALVWIFQDGRLEGLLAYESPGALEPSVLAVTFAVTFGLSMDYEMFLISRIREEHVATGDHLRSVAVGLGRTGRLITGAAAVLVAVVVGFVAGQMVFIKELGVGLGVAVLVDATVVRALLVPAFMAILGRHNWWAPAPVARWWARAGVGH